MSVLYDLPGPRARRRNLIISIVSGAAIVALIVYVVVRFVQTGQFNAVKWQQFEYVAVQKELLSGLGATLLAAALGSVFALLFGVVFAALRLTDFPILRGFSTSVVELFRAIPLLILIFFAYYGPLSFGFSVPKLWALVFGLTLYNGSVLAEIFRAGILAVPRGQSEAAAAVGLDRPQTLWLVLLPQAVRAMLPAIVSQLVVLLKDTALGFIITYPELLFQAKQIGGKLVFEIPYVPTYLITGTIYIGICGALSFFAYWLQKRLSRVPKTAATVSDLPRDPLSRDFSGA
jgi:glutamate transport system permease protein